MTRSTTTRRQVLTGVATLGVGIASPAIISRPGWSQTGPIKIGTIEVLSGPTKYIGEARMNAFNLVIERVNAAGGIKGRKVEIVSADSEYKNDVAARRVPDLVQGEKVDILGAFGGAIPNVVAAAAFKAKKLFVSTAVAPPDINGSEFLSTTFQCSPNTDMLSRAVASYVAKSDKKKVFILSYDISTGRAAGAGFRKRFDQIRKSDQTIVGEEYTPFQRLTDFAPYITKVVSSGADMVYLPGLGLDQRRIIQQGHDLGWNVQIVGQFLNDPVNSSTFNDAALGNVVIGAHQISMDTPKNREWIALWKAKYPNADLFARSVDSAVGLAISGFEWMFDVMKRSPDLETESLIKTWENSKFEMLWGPAEMRACDHQMQSQFGVAQFVKPDEIPELFRIYNFPYIKSVGTIPISETSVPVAETGNARCA